MKTDLIDVMTAIAEGRGSELNIEWDDRYSVSVVMVSGGYPMRHTTNHQITGTENVTKSDDVLLFHARTALSANRLITTGGRVLNVVALDETLEGARNKVYSEVEKIHFNDVHYRRDIAENFITEGEGI
jgi:phosphoribosylamine--glycine ligase